MIDREGKIYKAVCLLIWFKFWLIKRLFFLIWVKDFEQLVSLEVSIFFIANLVSLSAKIATIDFLLALFCNFFEFDRISLTRNFWISEFFCILIKLILLLMRLLAKDWLDFLLSLLSLCLLSMDWIRPSLDILLVILWSFFTNELLLLIEEILFRLERLRL